MNPLINNLRREIKQLIQLVNPSLERVWERKPPSIPLVLISSVREMASIIRCCHSRTIWQPMCLYSIRPPMSSFSNRISLTLFEVAGAVSSTSMMIGTSQWPKSNLIRVRIRIDSLVKERRRIEKTKRSKILRSLVPKLIR